MPSIWVHCILNICHTNSCSVNYRQQKNIFQFLFKSECEKKFSIWLECHKFEEKILFRFQMFYFGILMSVTCVGESRSNWNMIINNSYIYYILQKSFAQFTSNFLWHLNDVWYARNVFLLFLTNRLFDWNINHFWWSITYSDNYWKLNFINFVWDCFD